MTAIKGYRALSEEEINLINEIKSKGNELDSLIHIASNFDADPRWIEIAATHLQQGIMALVRSVAKPEGF